MKKYRIKGERKQRKHMVVGRPTTLSSISFDELYEDISSQWLEKSRRLQARRWRKIKHQTA
ncbi:MAG TPA: hypothetical protein VFW52_02850 [Candidatus Saccharimonadales bacterium]|nr:hypothetical protein [Candidatus Saccharimonadales bacterium]